ncbi:Potassium transporter [Friedmanniomyces endolithicus]|uniref:Potassium transporter n=1 Tax=Friedmanniomyces endolithicus TaxID=329885 RepID=A0AAN6JXY5_9PEZI|nr:Potassium transporter [Friedmanniomyces endolithicus]KAK0949872.1 Potassium transporter [Friedmanniomyces endolithicus]KAK1020917.1 Potassium transporter [Friedmanniomyces endolithicus]
MGCGSPREKGPPEEVQTWKFLNLSDLKATSGWTVPAYIWLWFMAFVAVAVYAVDTFTAVNLLAFDKWNGQVKPVLPFQYSKWIFAVCILLSWLLCFYETFRAVRVIRRGGVAQSYMDPLAVTLQMRIILAEGPRQAVNAMTLYAVMKADLIPTHGQHANVAQFFLNVKALAEKQEKQAVILFSMLFTLVGEDEITGSEESVAEIQLVLKIEQSLGNCPKYLNSKHIVPTFARPELISDGAQLPQLGLGLGLG